MQRCRRCTHAPSDNEDTDDGDQQQKSSIDTVRVMIRIAGDPVCLCDSASLHKLSQHEVEIPGIAENKNCRSEIEVQEDWICSRSSKPAKNDEGTRYERPVYLIRREHLLALFIGPLRPFLCVLRRPAGRTCELRRGSRWHLSPPLGFCHG